MKSKLTRFGAALAIAFAVATPIMAAAPADAAMIKVVDVHYGRDDRGPVNFGRDDRGPVNFARYEHRSERSYRDMFWQQQIRFHRHDMGWLRHHHFERFYDR
jgi:hypothetical protein